MNTSIPSFTGYTQEATKLLAPLTSTTQIRQAPISLISFKKQRVGMSIPASLAASKIVEPLGAVTVMPLIFNVTVSIVSSLFLGNCTKFTFFHTSATLYALRLVDNVWILNSTADSAVWTYSGAQGTSLTLLRIDCIGEK